MGPQIHDHAFSLCHIELYMVLLAPFDYVAHYSPALTLIIRSHTPKYGNQQKTSQDAMQYFKYTYSFPVGADGQIGGSQGVA